MCCGNVSERGGLHENWRVDDALYRFGGSTWGLSEIDYRKAEFLGKIARILK